jgi:hypothetical protein
MTPKRPRDPNQLAKSIIGIAARSEAIRRLVELGLKAKGKHP